LTKAREMFNRISKVRSQTCKHPDKPMPSRRADQGRGRHGLCSGVFSSLPSGQCAARHDAGCPAGLTFTAADLYQMQIAAPGF